MYPVEFLTNGVGWNGVHEQLTPVIAKPNGTKEYQVSDHLASLRVAIEGGAERHIDYDPWGMPTGAVAGERQTFNAQEQDHDTKLFDLTDRKYDAMVGGFPSPDRLWEKDRSRSPYVYCANNPLGMTDPGGMQARNNERPISAPVPDAGRGGGGGGGGGDFITPIITGIRSLFTRAAVAEAGAGVLASDPTIRQRAVDLLRTLATRSDVLSKIDLNKLNHIFGKAEHNLGGLLEQFGSRETAFYAIQQATQTMVSKQGLQGVFQVTITLGSETIAVRGNVVDGIVKIGTAFKP